MMLIGFIIILMMIVTVYSVDLLVKSGKNVQVGKTEVKQGISGANGAAIAVMCVVYNLVCGYAIYLLV